jgi:hypothetical protein
MNAKDVRNYRHQTGCSMFEAIHHYNHLEIQEKLLNAGNILIARHATDPTLVEALMEMHTCIQILATNATLIERVKT